VRAPLLVLTLVLAALSTQFAAADSIPFTTIAFSYSGVDVNQIGATSSGFGVFVFRKGLRTVSLSDLVGFEFFQTTVLLGDIPVPSTFFYSLANLTDFSAVLTGSRFTSTLSLDTVATAGTNPVFAPESFHIIMLGRSGAFTSNDGETLTLGTAMLAPEPASIILVATGLLGIVSRIRKGRSPRDPEPPNVAVL
jgi:PEP-CTERM motif-containing protein